jgi:orotate phosphoribosyltransferase
MSADTASSTEASPHASPATVRRGQIIARALLDVGAVGVYDGEKPFIFTAGWASPVYIDIRRLISFPRLRRQITAFAAETLMEQAGLETFDAVAGGETAGIPYAAWIAEQLSLPMLYVRKKPKGFGRNARIEGHIAPGARVLLVEDLASDGGSKVSFADALRTEECTVAHTFVVFFYDIFPGARAAMTEHGLTLHYLCTWWDVLAAMRASEWTDADRLDDVHSFLRDPISWSAAHGGHGTETV